MAITRRPLLTATAAGTLLCALWFVPSANATDDTGSAPGSSTTRAGGDADAATLAETGTGTTPYLLGGVAFLGIGAGFVTYSSRRTGPRPAL
ncbi:LPXTG-motif cell wall anchor domain-containing protein [Streptomyces sp. 2131.1]|uniref:LPXTG cell wall anchor domain-containing protein n=1 Tax=Streptomyces sp. 2131.1 TaxID=1855346 RepID=UPI00089A46C5|nr:LPXTG cell wall anchor domain-containing protein [Streptomyces sp. 2131.1]SEC73403.1 LPXTG-motif cell wall anchor domain-containing protein [Streptomyces sp. 2131.1]